MLVLAATIYVVEGRGGDGEHELGTVGEGRSRLMLVVSFRSTLRGWEEGCGRRHLVLSIF